jgi:Zn-dependent protease with chaperone function
VNETRTIFPKKIFVIPDVNAGVYFNSAFWSMFFPVGKNIEIGLGLVNTLNVSEFKSVIAHELGHFTQKSMKIGSYIYRLNRSIYSLVFEYDYWDKILLTISSKARMFGLFATITFLLAQRVRELLKIAYNLINITYSRLSREMEFHADLVALSMVGNETCLNTLRKMSFGAYAFGFTMSHIYHLAGNNKSSENVFSNHRYSISYLSKFYDLKVVDGMPVVKDEDIERNLVTSRIYIQDQWASHPSLWQRRQNINRFNIVSEENPKSAWALFNDVEKIQSEITQKIYQVEFHGTTFDSINQAGFENHMLEEAKKYNLSPLYNDFYKERFIEDLNIEELINDHSGFVESTFEEIYSRTNAAVIKEFVWNKYDLNLLKEISEKKLITKYFEFDGIKYRAKDADDLYKKLQLEIDEKVLKIKELDQNSFLFNYRLALKSESSENYVDKFSQVQEFKKHSNKMDEYYKEFYELSSKLYSGGHMSEHTFNELLKKISAFESKLRSYCITNNFESVVDNHLSDKEIKQYKEFFEATSNIFNSSDFNWENFYKLSQVFYSLGFAVRCRYTENLKVLTEFQLELSNLKVKEQQIN